LSALKYELLGLLLVALAALVALGFLQNGGIVGVLLLRLARLLLGDMWFLLAGGLFALGAYFVYRRARIKAWQRLAGALLLGLVSLSLAHSTMPGASWENAVRGYGGGVAGAVLALGLEKIVGIPGRTVVLVLFGLAGLLLLTNTTLFGGARKILETIKAWFRALGRSIIDFIYPEYEVEEEEEESPAGDKDRMVQRTLRRKEPRAAEPGKPEPASDPGPARPYIQMSFDSSGIFQMPPLSLLDRGSKVRPPKSDRDVAEKAKLLEDTLESFDVRAKVVEVRRGPTVTRYEVQPAPGVKVASIVKLANDIALAMASGDVRIEAPIPGKSAVGIEVPNREISLVMLREVLETPEFRSVPSVLGVALGKDIAGKPVVGSLETMVHLLIAGATGSGKSVCINAIIASLLYRARPDQLKFIMIDPKVVELSMYNGIPHLIAPVVTDPNKAAKALGWVIKEMARRYEAFATAGVRDIVKFNDHVAAALGKPGYMALPYIIVVIDELADLMVVAPVDVEDAIFRLAQMARAAGIHLVVATQRPSVDVITGTIKANIQSRIAFAVSSQVDSRTILDSAGAEKLLGRGDMLFFPVGASKPIRAQGAYISEEEIEEIVKFVSAQAKPTYEEAILKAEAQEIDTRRDTEDELFPQATRIIVEAGQASVSLLQRRLPIGYTRAARLIDVMELRGYIGPYEGSKPREVYLTLDEYNRIFNIQP